MAIDIVPTRTLLSLATNPHCFVRVASVFLYTDFSSFESPSPPLASFPPSLQAFASGAAAASVSYSTVELMHTTFMCRFSPDLSEQRFSTLGDVFLCFCSARSCKHCLLTSVTEVLCFMPNIK